MKALTSETTAPTTASDCKSVYFKVAGGTVVVPSVPGSVTSICSSSESNREGSAHAKPPLHVISFGFAVNRNSIDGTAEPAPDPAAEPPAGPIEYTSPKITFVYPSKVP